jgi:L-ascorbate metabolism protein UlaG (beta-lactamase superfamily)
MRLQVQAVPVELLREDSVNGLVDLVWFGQAGFMIRGAGNGIIVDPYLSDSLAKKYHGREFPHVRMLPIPVKPEELKDIDFVLCSHAHSDHMDPGTLPVLASASPGCRFVVPAASVDAAVSMGIQRGRVIPAIAGESLTLSDSLCLEVIPAAHETLETDAEGHHRFLGYILRLGCITIYHAGDCVPFEGLTEMVSAAHVDLALLPVNGRDEFRSSRGFAGNFHFKEAVDLCVAAGIPNMIAHHVGMFEFNTLTAEQMDKAIESVPAGVKVLKPQTGVMYVVDEIENQQEKDRG